MTVDPKSRLSAKETLEHPWLQDQETVVKATKLMDTQRLESMKISALNGILPPEWDQGKTNNGGVKRLLDDSSQAMGSKRCKMSVD